MEIICSKCGTTNADNSKFCIKCGSKLPEPEQFKHCVKCGTKLRAKDMFCDKCGTRQPEQHAGGQQGYTGTLAQQGNSGMLYGNGYQQGYGNGQPYPNPQMQQGYGNGQPYPNQQMNPQMQQGYGNGQPYPNQRMNPQMQQGYGNGQPQINPRMQQGYGNGQPQMNRQMQQSPQHNNNNNNNNKPRGIYSNAGIIVLSSITFVLLIAVIIHGVYGARLKKVLSAGGDPQEVSGIFGGDGLFGDGDGLFGGGDEEEEAPVPKTPKELFTYRLSKVAPQFSDTFNNLGASFFDMFVSINDIDTSISSTSTTDTTINLQMGEDSMSYLSSQSVVYNADSHDTSLVLSGGLDGSEPTACGYYYYGDNFLFDPASSSSPMVRYTLGEEKEALAKYAAVDRFAKMVNADYSDSTVDWDAATQDFETNALADVTDDDIIIGSESIDIWGESKACDSMTITKTGHEGIVLANEITNYLMQSIRNDDVESTMNNLTDESSMSQETIDGYTMSLSVYSLEDAPVGMDFSMTKDGQTVHVLIVDYEDGRAYDSRFELTDAASGSEFRGWDSAKATGGDSYDYDFGFYVYTVEEGVGSYYNVTMDTVGTETDSHKDRTGNFSIDINDSGKSTIINGTIDYNGDFNGGSYNTTNTSTYNVTSSEGEEMFHGSIISNSNCTAGDAQVLPPEFIDGSGIDVGNSHEELIRSFGEKFDSSNFAFENQTVRAFAVYLQAMNVNTSSYVSNDETQEVVE